MKPHYLGRAAKLAALVSVPALLVLALIAVAGAQTPEETPDASAATSTPDLSITTVVRIEVDPQPEPLEKGAEFEARVMVDNVERLAAFEFSISYDPRRLEPVKPDGAGGTPGATAVLSIPGSTVVGRGLGEILLTSPRAAGIFCSGPADLNGKVSATCVTNDAPVCLGGAIGAAGSGLLGAVTFRSKGGGPTTLTLDKSELVADDYDPPCDPNAPPEDPQVRLIPVRQQNAEVNLAESSGGSSTLLIIIVIVVVAAVLGAGAGGYMWYRGRQPGAGA